MAGGAFFIFDAGAQGIILPAMDKLSVSLLSTFTIALLHTLIPSHWLCFVVVGRAQGWRTRKTLAVTATAGFFHVLSTFLVGLAVAAFGKAFFDRREETLERLSGMILIGLGALYLISHLFHAGHHHEQDRNVREKAAFVALLISLVVSPCSASIPLLVLASASAGWATLLLVGGVLLVTTLGVMMLLVGLTSLGVERLQFAVFDRYEKLIVGGVLCVLGALVLLVRD
jgi:putative Mn2+ efflux pump MntP